MSLTRRPNRTSAIPPKPTLKQMHGIWGSVSWEYLKGNLESSPVVSSQFCQFPGGFYQPAFIYSSSVFLKRWFLDHGYKDLDQG